MLDDTDKSLVRQFLGTPAAKRWLEQGRQSCPKLDLAKVNVDNYHASLLVKEGWTGCIDFLQSAVQEDRPLEYGQPAIDTVAD